MARTLVLGQRRSGKTTYLRSLTGDLILHKVPYTFDNMIFKRSSNRPAAIGVDVPVWLLDNIEDAQVSYLEYVLNSGGDAIMTATPFPVHKDSRGVMSFLYRQKWDNVLILYPVDYSTVYGTTVTTALGANLGFTRPYVWSIKDGIQEMVWDSETKVFTPSKPKFYHPGEHELVKQYIGGEIDRKFKA